MAKRFLTHIDLSGNQLINASLEKLSADPVSGLFEGRMYYNTTNDLVKVYDGTQWVSVGSVTDVQAGTDIDVSSSAGVYTISLESEIGSNTTGNAATATALQTARTISLAGDVTGSASFNGTSDITITATVDSQSAVNSITGTAGEIDVSASVGDITISLPSTISADISGTAASATFATTASVANLANAVAANSVALGTDTTGNYVASVSASDGISASGTGEGASVSLTNTDKGSSQNIFKTISGDTGSVTAGSNSASVTIAGGTGITTSASAGTITVDNDGILSVSGTANQISASTVSGAVTLSLPNAVTFPGTVTLNADPSNPLEAATKQYVDSVAEGLNVHPSVYVATTASVDLNNPPAAIDGVTLTDGMRVLVKNQSTTSENGIYVYDAANTDLVRAADYNTAAEIDPGDFFFVTAGNTFADTGWVQTATVVTLGTDPITFTQFSGAGTYVAGNGLTLTGNSFSINTAITADLTTAQTLTNKTLTSPVVSGLYLSDNNIIVEGTNDVHETTLVFTDPTQDNTITFKNATGTVAFTSDIPSNTDGLTEGSTNLYFTNERAEDAIGAILTDTDTIDLTYTDNGASAGSITADVKLKASNSYLATASGLAVDISALETKLVTDSFTKKVSASVGNGSNTSFAVSHNLNSRDVVVNVYDNSSYDTVECDVVRTDANTVTVSFASAPANNAYRVVVVG